MELRYSICTSRWTQNKPPNRLINVSTVNNGVVVYPKFVKTKRCVPSVATSIQQTVIKNTYAGKKHEKTKDCIPPIEIYYVNCGKDHTAFDKTCEMYQELWKKLNRVNL